MKLCFLEMDGHISKKLKSPKIHNDGCKYTACSEFEILLDVEVTRAVKMVCIKFC